MHVSKLVLAAFLLLAVVPSITFGGAVLELEPSNPGPYFGGEALTVDFWLRSDQTTDVRLQTLQLDFSDSDSRLSLGSMFTFDFSSLPRNYYAQQGQRA